MQAAGGTPLKATTSADGKRRRIGILLLVTAVAWAADLATKVLAVEALAGGRVIEVIPQVLNLVLIKNPGAAFGIASAYTPILAVVMIAVISVILRIARKLRSVSWAFALGLLLAGAFGNLTDRVFREPGFLRGHVIDFLQLPNWPVFNLADTSICISAVLIILLTLRGRRVDGTRESDGVPDAEAVASNPAAATGTDVAATTEPAAEAGGTDIDAPSEPEAPDEETDGPCGTPSNGGRR